MSPAGLLGIGSTFYFCIPRNDRLLGYWDTVADRLFKIRNCMNIEGVVRQLPLFEPPIDPALLVKAAAQGSGPRQCPERPQPPPPYRFTTMLGKALEGNGRAARAGRIAAGNSRKRDEKRLAALRAGQETDLLNLVREVKQQQITEARTALEALQKTRDTTQVRLDYYTNIVQRIGEETQPTGGAGGGAGQGP